MCSIRGYRLFAVLLSVLLAAPGVWAAEGKASLDRFLRGLSTMRTPFVQTLLNAAGEPQERSEGVLLLSRPGRFRLEYHKPYEQLYVADGQRLWMYDKDLQQVTVREQREALGNTPALLLSGTEPLDDNFVIEDLGVHEGIQWLELRPREEQPNFEYVRLALEDDVLLAMEMSDGMGQTTRLHFVRIERNPDLSAASFRFTPPPGVDVVGDQR